MGRSGISKGEGRQDCRRSTLRACATVVICLFCTACGPNPKPAAKTNAVGWRPIAKWSGRGDVQTDSFNIEGGQWRIKWTTSNEQPPGTGTFKVTANSAISGRPIAIPIDHKGPGHDVAYINEDPRLYHLVIESRNIDWTIAIEDSVVGY